MQAMAQKMNLTYRTKVNRGEPRTLTVGFSSDFPDRHVALLTGERLDRTEVQPDAVYERFAVGRQMWSGPIYACGYRQEVVEQSVNEIAAALEERLK